MGPSTPRPRTALVTGAASGIGAEAALRLAGAGVGRLLLLDVAEDGLRRVGGELRGRCPGAAAETCVLDVTDRGALDAVLVPRLRTLGRLDVLVNSAGVADVNEPEDSATWRRVLDVNLHGARGVTLRALPHMGEDGRIVNVASVLGRLGHARNTAYCASKHALVGLTRALAEDLAPRRITVNAVLPCSIDTPMYRRELAMEAARAGMEAASFEALAVRNMPIGRFVRAGEVGALIAFLALPEAGRITGQDWMIDGGQTCGMP